MKEKKSYFLQLKNSTMEEKIALFSNLGVEQADDWDETPLVYAISQGDFDLMKALIAMGASPLHYTSVHSPFGAALHQSREVSHAIFLSLVDQVAPISRSFHDNYCPDLTEPLLHAAIRLEKIVDASYLVEKGYDPSWKSMDLQSGWEMAKEFGCLGELVKAAENIGLAVPADYYNKITRNI